MELGLPFFVRFQIERQFIMFAHTMAETATPEQIKRAIAIGLPIVLEIDRKVAELSAATAPASTTPIAAPVAAPVAAAPVHAGKIGEAAVLSAIRGVWPAAQNISARPHSGDIVMRTADGRVTIEVKNYTGAVPRSQVDKFFGDMRTTGADAGMFISIGSAITGMESSPMIVKYENFGKFVPVVWMVKPSVGEIRAGCTIIGQLLGAIAYTNALAREHETAIDALSSIADSADLLSVTRMRLNEVITATTGRLIDVSSDIRGVERTIRECANVGGLIVGGAVDAGTQITADPRWNTYSEELRNCLTTLIAKVNALAPSVLGGWKTGGKSYIHTFSGITLSLLSTSAKITIPRAMIADAELLSLLIDMEDSIVVRGRDVTLTVTEETGERVCGLV